MNFRSDNTASAAAEILAALSAVNGGQAAAYGEDPWSAKLDAAFSKLFERDVRVFTVATGTAANAISLATLAPPWGAIYCHREAHVMNDECGAPEFYSGGAKLVGLDGEAAKIAPAALEAALAREGHGVHTVKAAALSLSQTTERGAIYKPDEIAALAVVAHTHGMGVHMDGSRFANAVAALGCAPADVTWRAGVDLLSFGATKNGAVAAEAIIAFDPAHAEQIERRRKRGGQLLSKGRYAAAQLLAYIENGLWLKLAGRANTLAKRLGEAAGQFLSHPAESNQIFVKAGEEALARLRAAGADFYDWTPGEARLVVSWNQPESEVDVLAGLLAKLR